MTSLRLGLCQWHIGAHPPRPGADPVASWVLRLDDAVQTAAGQGARVLVLPEYAAVEAAAGAAPDLPGELARAIEAAPAILEAARGVARRHGVWLLPGTLPFARPDGTVRNRAPLIDPEGRVAFQDKHVMTRFEAEQWGISPGDPPAVFATPWGRIGIAICFDSEFPTLVRAQVEAGAWLILVPSCTDTLAGFNRVRIACAARAMENQCFVAMAPTIGIAPWCATLDSNRGYAAVFGPVDRGFPDDGELARGALDQPQWVFADLEPARLDAVRTEGAVRNHASWPAPPPPAPVVSPA